MRIYDDLDSMPFGKYKGVPLQDVPASYFHYLWHNGLKSKTKEDGIADYINRSLSALKQENADLVW